MQQDRKKQLMEVFGDTEYQYVTNPKLQEAIARSGSRQYVIRESEKVKMPSDIQEREKPASIEVLPVRTLEAARLYQKKKTAVLNFASAVYPGGGVRTGNSAQEESLCRCSTLFANISEDKIEHAFHRNHRILLREKKMDLMYNDDCVYTPDVVVFKTDAAIPELLEEKEWYCVDVITCAAPNLRDFPEDAEDFHMWEEEPVTEEELLAIHKKRARRVLEIAKSQKEEVLILGAFGCGVFLNPPELVAAAWKQVAESYRMYFDKIIFAVYSSQKDSLNFAVFKEIVEQN